jgi:hypothetical protein
LAETCRSWRASGCANARDDSQPGEGHGQDTILVYTVLVYWGVPMKNITLSADEDLIEAARARARAEHTTLNEQFRRWLGEYTQRQKQADAALAVIGADLRVRR